MHARKTIRFGIIQIKRYTKTHEHGSYVGGSKWEGG